MLKYNNQTKKGITEMVLYWTKQCLVEYVPFECYAYHYCKANRPYYLECKKTKFPYPIVVTQDMMSIFVKGTPNTSKFIKTNKKKWNKLGDIAKGFTDFSFKEKKT